MKPLFFKTLWGHEGEFDIAARRAVDAGFAGMEGPLPADLDRRQEFLDALEDHRLLYIGEISTTGFAVPDPHSNVNDHLAAFERILVATLPASPIFFTAMAGNDLWSFRDSIEFFTKAHEIATRNHVRVGFETHRSRSLYHPIITQSLLAELPPIELTLDFSHWCNVCERLVLDELPEVLKLCASRGLHIQPRVGYDQGAQIPDPRSPRYQGAVEAHLRWWKVVWASQRERGFIRSTMTPEFGPDGYLQTDPWTGKPVGDLWEMNTHMAEILRSAFQTINNGEF